MPSVLSPALSIGHELEGLRKGRESESADSPLSGYKPDEQLLRAEQETLSAARTASRERALARITMNLLQQLQGVVAPMTAAPQATQRAQGTQLGRTAARPF